MKKIILLFIALISVTFYSQILANELNISQTLDTLDLSYITALQGNNKVKINYLKNSKNSEYSKIVEKALFESFKSIQEVASFSSECPEYYEKSVIVAYNMAKTTKDKTELNSFISFFGASQYITEIKNRLSNIDNIILDEEKQQKIADEKAKLEQQKKDKEEKERKIAEEKKREEEYQKYLINKEKVRVNKIKTATEGDKICYVQDRVTIYDDRTYFFGYVWSGSKQEVNYKMKVICFVEKNLGEKMQVRVVTVKSTNKNEYTTPIIDGIEYQKGDIIWIKPLKDSNWFIED